ncbi:phospholipase A2-like [Sparus aurata]|uniref:Phospholipase A2 n=1 Tax=Sparus aurata TaxID=8175 RepID=A0A671U6S1_SPAAU|nr:phospholipase A2-like [Sparus aurata]
MNLSGPLLLLLLSAACKLSDQQESSAFWQFGNMIWCVQPGVIPFKYNNYGCYCGLGGAGTPVDEVDQCCKVHDDCYTAKMKNHQCRGFSRLLFFVYYQYSCAGGQPTCSATNDYCQAAACECDRAAALCFTQAKYNPEHKNLDERFCKK